MNNHAEIEYCTECLDLPARFRSTSGVAATAAATVATATAAAIPAVATTTTAIAAKAASATTTATILAWAGFVDFQRATGNFLSVELFNRGRRFFFRRHFHESETFRLSSIAILDHACRFNRSGLSKQFLKILTGSLESEVSDIKFFDHRDTFSSCFNGEKKLRIGFDFGERWRSKDQVRMLSLRAASINVNKPALEPSKRSALIFLARSASPSMRERRVNQGL
jgi:hypothetical protein